MVPQLWHVGAARTLGSPPDPTVPGYGPCAVEKDGRTVVVGMGEADIEAVAQSYARGARHARELGFDGVAVHGAHGYLIDQFLRDGVNDRTDAYGGSLANRARLLFEVVDASISVFGAGRVGLRFSPLVPYNDMVDSDPAALVAHVAAESEKRGLGFLELRHDNFDRPEEYELARIARQNFSGALVRNGGFTRDAGEAAIREGLADAIAYGVPFLANPDLPMRFLKNAPLNQPDVKTFYATASRAGYTDYPFLAA